MTEHRNPLLLTVDVEPDWGIEGDRSVVEALPRLLDLLDRFQAKATFFVTGGMAERHARLLRRAAESHEIGSHGHTHRRLDRLTAHDVSDEIARSKEALAEIGCPPQGIRAPFFRAPDDWAAMVRAAGYRYDASLGACHPSPRNVKPEAWEVAEDDGLVRLSTCSLNCGWIPFCLTYQRLLGRLAGRLIPADGPMFYLHLHELMPRRLGCRLAPPMRWILTRNAGEPAWAIIENLLRERHGDTVTCAGYLGLTGKEDCS